MSTYQEQTAAYKAAQRARGEQAVFHGTIVYIHNWPPEHLYVWEGWVDYNPYHPRGDMHPRGYYVPENHPETPTAPEWQQGQNPRATWSNVRTFLEVRNIGGGAVTVTVDANPTHLYTYTAPAGQTLKVGPFLLYASNGGFRFTCTPTDSVQVRVVREEAAATFGLQMDRSVPPAHTTYPNP